MTRVPYTISALLMAAGAPCLVVGGEIMDSGTGGLAGLLWAAVGFVLLATGGLSLASGRAGR